MPDLPIETIRDVARSLQMAGSVVRAEPYGNGHIHDTFSVVTDASEPPSHYVFQRINVNIFRNVDCLMENICRVTEHARARLAADPERYGGQTTLDVVPARDGRPWVCDGEGAHWRAYVFVENALSFDVFENTNQAYEAAKAYGLFQGVLADFPDPPLHETIPDFHNTPKRLKSLQAAIASDALNRAKGCADEIEFALSLEPLTGTITDGLASGDLACRVTHNDTKLNNVLLHKDTGKGVCVIDLDTVMPGSVLYDFGDSVRSMVGHFDENEKNLEKVWIDMDRFDALARGYMEAAREFLSPREIQLLPLAGLLMTYEVGIRFLTDYMEGDTYFKIHYPGENIDRARTQLALVKHLREQEGAMLATVTRYCD